MVGLLSSDVNSITVNINYCFSTFLKFTVILRPESADNTNISAHIYRLYARIAVLKKELLENRRRARVGQRMVGVI